MLRGLPCEPVYDADQRRPLQRIRQRIWKSLALGVVVVLQIAEDEIDALPGIEHQLTPQLLSAKWTARITGQFGRPDQGSRGAGQVLHASIEARLVELSANRNAVNTIGYLFGHRLSHRLVEVITHIRDQQHQLSNHIGRFRQQNPQAVRVLLFGLEMLRYLEHRGQAGIDAWIDRREFGGKRTGNCREKV